MIHLAKGLIGGAVCGTMFIATTVDSNSLIPIGGAIAVMMVVGGAIWKISQWKTKLEIDLKNLRTERRYDMDSIKTIDTPTEPQFRATVLIIDDDQYDRYLVRQVLDRVQFKTLEAATLQEGRDILKNHTVDCVLLDLNLPDSSPSETVPNFVREYPKALCIVLSGNENPEVQATALAAGADAFVYKMQTADPDYLPRMITKAMGRRAIRNYESKASTQFHRHHD